MINLKQRTVGLALSITLCILMLFAVIISGMYLSAQTLLRSDADRYNQLLAEKAVEKIEQRFTKIEAVAEVFKNLVEDPTVSQEELQRHACHWVNSIDGLHNLTVAYDPVPSEEGKPVYQAFAAVKIGETALIKTGLAETDYNYPYWDWYQLAKELQKPIWTPIYYGSMGEDKMVSYCIPFKESAPNGRSGVIDADITTSFLNDIVGRMQFLQGGYCYILSSTGNFVVHPNPDIAASETIYSVAEQYDNDSIRRLITSLEKYKRGKVPFTNMESKEQGQVFFSPIRSTNWSLGLFVPKREFTANISALSENMYVMVLLVMFGSISATMLVLTIKEFWNGRTIGETKSQNAPKAKTAQTEPNSSSDE